VAEFRASATDTGFVIDAQKAHDPGAGTAALQDTTLLDASRWAVWQSLARGLAHSLANASQLLMLEHPSPTVIAEARARVSRAHALLTTAGRPAESKASFLPSVLADFDALQQLQAGLPGASLVMDVEGPLPMTAIPEADVLHVLLLIGTRLKEARSGKGLEILVRVRAVGGEVRVELAPVDPPGTRTEPGPGAARAPLLEASAVLVTRAGGSLREADSGWELALPVYRR
jgi:hypothetical protein